MQNEENTNIIGLTPFLTPFSHFNPATMYSPGRKVSCGDGEIEVGSYHSHPRDSGFSDADRDYANKTGKPLYKGIPNGSVECLDPDPKYNPEDPSSGKGGKVTTIDPPIPKTPKAKV